MMKSLVRDDVVKLYHPETRGLQIIVGSVSKAPSVIGSKPRENGARLFAVGTQDVLDAVRIDGIQNLSGLTLNDVFPTRGDVTRRFSRPRFAQFTEISSPKTVRTQVVDAYTLPMPAAAYTEAMTGAAWDTFMNQPGAVAIRQQRAMFMEMRERFYAEYEGKYVAFSNGEILDSDTDDSALLLRTRQLRRERPVLVTRLLRVYRPVEL